MYAFVSQPHYDVGYLHPSVYDVNPLNTRLSGLGRRRHHPEFDHSILAGLHSPAPYHPYSSWPYMQEDPYLAQQRLRQQQWQHLQQQLVVAARQRAEEERRRIEAIRLARQREQERLIISSLYDQLFALHGRDDLSSDIRPVPVQYTPVHLAPHYHAQYVTPHRHVHFEEPTIGTTPHPPEIVDRKGKGRETPAIPLPRSLPVPTNTSTPPSVPPTAGPSLKERLHQRKASDEDADIQETLNSLIANLFGIPIGTQEPQEKSAAHTVPAAETKERVRIPISTPSSAQPQTSTSSTVPVTSTEPLNGGNLKRTPAISSETAERLLDIARSRRARKLSLITIKEIEDTLHALEASFKFPSNIDFLTSPLVDDSDSASELSLAYTSKNKIIHSYEQSLVDLLTKLDAVESQGDEEVRGRRKEVVHEVEKALEEVSRKVDESRERASVVEKEVNTPLVDAADEVVPTSTTEVALPAPSASPAESAPSPKEADTQVDSAASELVVPPAEVEATVAVTVPQLIDPELSDALAAHEVEQVDAVSPEQSSAETLPIDTHSTTDGPSTATQDEDSVSPALAVANESDESPLQSSQISLETADNASLTPDEDEAVPAPNDPVVVDEDSTAQPAESSSVVEETTKTSIEITDDVAIEPQESDIPPRPSAPTPISPKQSFIETPELHDSPELPDSPSATNDDADQDLAPSFLLQSSPLPDPEPRPRHVEPEPDVQSVSSESSISDDDLEIVDGERKSDDEKDDWSEVEA